MALYIYKLQCITNLHVGSGDFNYGVIDNEVERDCLSGNPVIHASGIKGALRDLAESRAETEAEKTSVIRIFGGKGDNEKDTKAGEYKFFDAQLLSRPLRVSGSEDISSISVTTPEIINSFIDTLAAFGFDNLPEKIKKEDLADRKFYSSKPGIFIESDEEDFKAAEIPAAVKATLDAILGGDYAITKSFAEYKLPVIARNKLGQNKNLWYEEYVPHGSVFYMMIMSNEEVSLDFSAPVQFGGNSSIGYGYTKVTEFEVK